MFLYIFRVILVFWIISIIIKWIERLISPGASNTQQPAANHKPADPEPTPSMGKIVDAEFEDLDDGK